MSTEIKRVIARRIFNSRGDETIEVDIETSSGFGRAAAPAGASKGLAEVKYFPKDSVLDAVRLVEMLIAHRLVGMDASQQEEIDTLLHDIDGTDNFSKIGGNTAYAISLCAAKATADSHHALLFEYLGGYLAYELPYPLGNVLSGGRHAHGRAPDIQEFLVLPIGAESFWDAAKANVAFHQKVGEILRQTRKTFTSGRSDEGAWIADINNDEAFELMAQACQEVSNQLGFTCRVGIDLAASTLWDSEHKCYRYSHEGTERTPEEQVEYVLDLIQRYSLIYVEDPFHEEDYQNFAWLTKTADGCLICGDDLFVTNVERLRHGIEESAGNSVIIKPNQIGTLTDAWQTAKTAKEALYAPIVSHRSGDTVNAEISHLAVAFHCPIIKTGVIEGARIAKIDELIRIEDTLRKRARMAEIPLHALTRRNK
ncbi:MAG: phosphopyruvate hydratase [Candidatus Bathyarchaeota archaeon]|nr:MAG: phosphopyruvate hydratase [Candidatus Bathyarchaeota archaeon]